jgi:L-asparagine transporter-like permease
MKTLIIVGAVLALIALGLILLSRLSTNTTEQLIPTFSPRGDENGFFHFSSWTGSLALAQKTGQEHHTDPPK